MTERLTQLLVREAEGLDVPPPPAAAVLDRGRGLRRRRRTAAGVAAVTVLALAGTSLALLAGDPDPDARGVDPAQRATTAAADLGVVFSIGNRVYLDGGAVSVTIDDTSVKSFYYTSAGLVVRQGDNPYSDGGGPQRFSLVTPDGTVTRLSLETEEVAHTSDPTQPYLAYADRVGGVLTAVVLDVRTDREVASVPLPDHSGGFAPVSLSGDTLYVGDPERERTFEVDWRTGGVEVATGDDSYGSVVAGRATVGYGDRTTVVDVTTGETLLEASLGRDEYGYFDLSPDGRWAELAVEDTGLGGPAPGLDVYDVASGAHVTVPGRSYDYGWTPDGTLFSVSPQGVLRTCSPSTGECTDEQLALEVVPDQYADAAPVETCDENGCMSQVPEDVRDDLVLGGTVRES